ncbi:MAG: septum formation inhibitor Maf [Gammaproteobacteria bacterium]|nr:septum formation inhibitor Maf [Gammaproteobacteria bacterium]NNC66807.1 septum formation inhibitor Maf [Gammaproteobacteria bacterium]
MNIVLASSSAYRKQLLSPLIPSLTCVTPSVDESIKTGESAENYVSRLALEKATTVAKKQKNALVIGSDQCAVLKDKIISKPGNHEKALAQLKASSGKCVTFYTGLCVINTKTNSQQVSCEAFQVTFRKLGEKQIIAYLAKDQPYDCAGSFKAEGLGVTLFEKMQGDDYNTLIGLPLIKLTSMLQAEGFDPLTFN